MQSNNKVKWLLKRLEESTTHNNKTETSLTAPSGDIGCLLYTLFFSRWCTWGGISSHCLLVVHLGIISFGQRFGFGQRIVFWVKKNHFWVKNNDVSGQKGWCFGLSCLLIFSTLRLSMVLKEKRIPGFFFFFTVLGFTADLRSTCGSNWRGKLPTLVGVCTLRR